MFKLTTINVRGLNDNKKRNEIFKYLIKKDYDIIALQETHCPKGKKEKWESEWPGLSYFTEGKSNSTGLAFLFKENLIDKIIDDDPDLEQRILRLTVKIEDNLLQLINLYAPNSKTRDKSEYFFQKADNHFLMDQEPILFGDFNMVENLIDRQGGNPQLCHTYGSHNLNAIKEDYTLIDIWRRTRKGNHH